MNETEYDPIRNFRLPAESCQHLERLMNFIQVSTMSAALRIICGSTERLFNAPILVDYFAESINSEREAKAPRGNSQRITERIDDEFWERFCGVGSNFRAKSFSESVKRILRFWNSLLDLQPTQTGPILKFSFTTTLPRNPPKVEVWFFCWPG